ncbi:MAG: ABC transporter permease [Helicobacter sp.]|nr:ABC transporter permease [Helicobacter sp.]
MNPRFIIASLAGNRFQKALMLWTFILSAMLLSAMLNITLGIGNAIAKELRSFGSNIVVLPKGASLSIEVGDTLYTPLAAQSFLDEDRLKTIKEIFWRNSIIAFAPFLEFAAKATAPNGTQFDVALSGSYFDKNLDLQDEPTFRTGLKSLYPLWQITGQWALDDSHDSVMIGSELARRQNLGVGDSLFLSHNERAREVRIVGIIAHSGAFETKIIAPLALAQWLANKPKQFFKAEVSALTIPENALSQKARNNIDSLSQVEFDSWYCSAFVSSIAYQIEEDFKGTSAKPQLSISDAESTIVKKIQSLMALSSLLAMLAATASIASLLITETQRRRAEIALHKVLGATLLQIYLLFAFEALFVGMLGAAIGFLVGQGIGEGIAYLIFGHFLPLSWVALPLCLAFGALIALFASLFLLDAIADLPPAQVLYGR